jgi:hypothetical protein
VRINRDYEVMNAVILTAVLGSVLVSLDTDALGVTISKKFHFAASAADQQQNSPNSCRGASLTKPVRRLADRVPH